LDKVCAHTLLLLQPVQKFDQQLSELFAIGPLNALFHRNAYAQGYQRKEDDGYYVFF